MICAAYDATPAGDREFPMPTLLRAGPYRFFIFMLDCVEPAQVHVEGNDGATLPTMKSIRIDDDRLVFEVGDDREVSLPLSVSDRLSGATPAQLEHWTISWGGLGAHWPDVAEDTYLRSLREAPVS